MAKTKYKLGQKVRYGIQYPTFVEERICTVRGIRLGTLHNEETAKELGIHGLENEEVLYELVDDVTKQIFFQIPESEIHDPAEHIKRGKRVFFIYQWSLERFSVESGICKAYNRKDDEVHIKLDAKFAEEQDIITGYWYLPAMEVFETKEKACNKLRTMKEKNNEIIIGRRCPLV